MKGRIVLPKPETSLPIEPHKSWLDLDNKKIGYQFGAWFIKFAFDETGFNLAQECRQKSVDQIWTEYRDKDEFVKPLLRNLPKIARQLDAFGVDAVTLQKAAEFFTKGKLERAGSLIREFLKRRVELDQLERDAIPYHQRQKKIAKKSRRKDGLHLFIVEYFELVVRTNDATTMAEKETAIKAISYEKMLAVTKAAEGSDHIDRVRDGVIHYKNHDRNGRLTEGGRTKSTFKNLRNRLRKEKPKYIDNLALL